MLKQSLGLVLLVTSSASLVASTLVPASLHVLEWRLNKIGALPAAKAKAEVDALATFPVYNFTQPLDHFHETGHTFNQRYWVSTRHYRPGTGAPVIVLDGGETSGANRIPFLDTGIVDILTEATGGVGVILEHRYYGKFLRMSVADLQLISSSRYLCSCPQFHHRFFEVLGLVPH